MHRETVAATMRVNPGLLENPAAAAAAILYQYIRGQSQITENIRILREDRIWEIIPG